MAIEKTGFCVGMGGTQGLMEAAANDSSGSSESERRQHARVTRVELAVRFDGQTYKTSNWSMGGFLLDDYHGHLSTGSLVTVQGLGRDAPSMETVELAARVVRTSERVMAVNYLSLDAAAYELLQQLMSETGKMRSLL